MEAHKKILQLFSLLILIAALFFVLTPEEKMIEEFYATKGPKGENATNFKVVQLAVDGQNLKIVTGKKIVKEILAELELVLNPEDKTIPALDGFVEDTVQVIRVVKKIIEERKVLAYPIEENESADLYLGEQRILQKGEKGIEKDVYEVVCEDGQEVARHFLEKVKVKEPVKQIVALGTRQTVSRGGNSLKFTETYKMTATAYTHTGNRTATGIWPSVGVVAVDPRVIPLGTRLYVDGYGYATAADVGGLIKGKRIDVFLETKEETRRWGRRDVQVFVLDND